VRQDENLRPVPRSGRMIFVILSGFQSCLEVERAMLRRSPAAVMVVDRVDERHRNTSLSLLLIKPSCLTIKGCDGVSRSIYVNPSAKVGCTVSTSQDMGIDTQNLSLSTGFAFTDGSLQPIDVSSIGTATSNIKPRLGRTERE